MTNAHVVDDADLVKVKLADDREYRAKVVGKDVRLDVAVLKLEDPPNDLPVTSLGSSDALRVGEYVVAIGNPFGLGNTVTMGIVSAKGRTIGAGPYDDFIQTDASINPGNSGGPLFNLRGQVVGINTAINPQGKGIGFAIPIDAVRDVVPQLLATGHVSRGRLGVVIQGMDEDLAKAVGLDHPHGALVEEVEPGEPGREGRDPVRRRDRRRRRARRSALRGPAAPRRAARARHAGEAERRPRHARSGMSTSRSPLSRKTATHGDSSSQAPSVRPGRPHLGAGHRCQRGGRARRRRAGRFGRTVGRQAAPRRRHRGDWRAARGVARAISQPRFAPRRRQADSPARQARRAVPVRGHRHERQALICATTAVSPMVPFPVTVSFAIHWGEMDAMGHVEPRALLHLVRIRAYRALREDRDPGRNAA